jgi:cysteine desulfurase
MRTDTDGCQIMGARIYLDHAAAAPLVPAAARAITAALGVVGNPSSIHGEGRAARVLLDRARAEVAALAGIGQDGVVFTGSGSEALALALHGLAGASAPREARGMVAVSAIEHPCVHATAEQLAAAGVVLARIDVDRHGRLDGDALARALAAGASTVVIGAVNHELGVVQDLAGISAQVRAAGARLVVDAVAAAGKLPLPPLCALADAVAIASAKVGGPAGVGALLLARELRLPPRLPGHQERGRRGGSENLLGIVGFAAALAAADPAEWAEVAARGARLEAGALAIPGVSVHGAGAPRVGGLINLDVGAGLGQAVVIGLDLEGIATSTGAACSSGTLAPSPVLLALGHDPAAARGVVRISLGRSTTDAEIDAVLAVLPVVLARARAHAPAAPRQA